MQGSYPFLLGTMFQPLGWEDPLEKEMATHTSILAWRIPWTEEPGGLLSIGSHKVRLNWSDLFLGQEDTLENSRLPTLVFLGFPGDSDGKESVCNMGDLGLIPGLEISPGGGHGNPLQYSCLENSMDRAWWATVHGVAKNQRGMSG